LRASARRSALHVSSPRPAPPAPLAAHRRYPPEPRGAHLVGEVAEARERAHAGEDLTHAGVGADVLVAQRLARSELAEAFDARARLWSSPGRRFAADRPQRRQISTTPCA